MIPITRDFLLADDASLAATLQAIDKSGHGIVFIVDGEGRLTGVVTDHDIRKALLHGVALTDPVAPYVNRKPVVARAGTPRDELAGFLRAAGKLQLPLVDEQGRPIALETLSTLMELDDGAHGHAAVIMAGGLGSRLRPLTDHTPKPLLPIGDKPILQIMIEELRRYGFRDIYIALNHFADQIEARFGDGDALGVRISYLREQEPMGTAGALRLLPPGASGRSMLVMNGDLLTRVDFMSLLSYHAHSGLPMTMCVRQYRAEIPYGVVDIVDSRVVGVAEKPLQVCFINAGIYVVDRPVLDLIPPEGRYDMTELVGAAVGRHGAVGSFPIHEYWLDIGRQTDYERAHLEYERYF